MRRIPAFLSVVVIALLAWATTAHASTGPQPTETSPAAGEHLSEPPAEVSMTFNEPIDPSSVMKVVDECGHRIDDRGVIVSLMEMRVGIADTPSGMYRVVYAAQGVGGVTGTTVGEFEFMVMTGTACSASSGDHDHGDMGEKDHSSDHGEHDGGATHDGHNDPGTSGDHGHKGSASEDSGHENHEADSGEPGPGETIAAPVSSPPPVIMVAPVAAPSIPEATTTAVFASLVIAAVVGLLGGWLLRRMPAAH